MKYGQVITKLILVWWILSGTLTGWAQNFHWQQTSGPEGTTVSDLTFRGNQILANFDGFVYSSNDEGSS